MLVIFKHTIVLYYHHPIFLQNLCIHVLTTHTQPKLTTFIMSLSLIISFSKWCWSDRASTEGLTKTSRQRSFAHINVGNVGQHERAQQTQRLHFHFPYFFLKFSCIFLLKYHSRHITAICHTRRENTTCNLS
jgi:hypothetical protein